jgi:hypothetical protein
MNVSETLVEKWEPIVNSVSKSNVPSNCLRRLVIKLSGKDSPTQKTINVQKLRKQGVSYDDIDIIIDWNLYELADDIKSVQMYVDLAAVANIVQPVTDRLLKQ